MAQITEFSFEVGESERHIVDFSFNQSIGILRIKVDGESRMRRFRMFNLATIEQFQLSVGTNEKHDVKIEKKRERMLGGFRPQSYSVFVDDRLIRTY